MDIKNLSKMLSEYHNSVVIAARADDDNPKFNQGAADAYDSCADLAIQILADAGLEPESEDTLGVEIGGDIQTLLQLAMFRSPQLRYYLETAQQLVAMNAAQVAEGEAYNNDEPTFLEFMAYGRRVKVTPRVEFYTNKRIAVQFDDASSGEMYGSLTVNIPDARLEPGGGEMLIKTWGENEYLFAAAREAGWLEDTGIRVATGYVKAWVMKPAGYLAKLIADVTIGQD